MTIDKKLHPLKTIFRLLNAALLLAIMPMCSILPGMAVAGSDTGLNPELRIERLQNDRSQQILFMHFDKREYLAGDTIWFKVYLANASDFTTVPGKHRINIELIDVQNQVVKVAFVQSINGMANGYIGLPTGLPGGNYLVRAYTDWMKNFDPELYFTKELFVVNQAELLNAHQRQVRINRAFNKRLTNLANQWQVTFFPEGGSFIVGLENRIAFRATDGLGNGIEVSGEIQDSDRKVVTTFETEFPGYGAFNLRPHSHRVYYAIVRNAKGQQQRIALPQQVSQGYTLSASIEDESVKVNVLHHPFSQSGSPAYYLLGVSGRGIEFLEKFEFNEGQFYASLPLEKLHTGILHWVLLDASLQSLAERTQFINNLDFSIVDMEVFQLAVQPDEGFEVNIKIDLGSQFRENGSFSLAVTTADEKQRDYQISPNIIEEYFLAGNLRNATFETWRYLMTGTAGNRRKLDLIMLTNSWLRFDAGSLAIQQLPPVAFHPSAYFTVRGMIQMPEGRALRGPADVRLRLQGDLPRQFSATSAKDGSFTFSNVPISGVVQAEVSATAGNFPGGVQIKLFPITAQSVNFPISPFTRKHTEVAPGRRSTDRLAADPIRSPLTRLTRKSADDGSSLATPDQVIFVDDMMEQQFRTVFDLLRTHASGLSVSSGRVLLRGPTTIRGTSEPMFGLDGMFTSRDHLLSLRTSDIDRIEIYKGPSASIFGVRGANGVIMARSRTGLAQTTITAQYQITGFQPNKHFTPPAGQTVGHRSVYETTLAWITDIKPDSNGVASLWVRFPAKPPQIRLVLQGLDQHGNLYFGEQVIQF